MKKRISAVLLALVLAMSFAACGKTDDDKNKDSSSESGGLYTSNEETNIENAKALIAQWGECINNADYSGAAELMNSSAAEKVGLDRNTDGDSIGKFSFEIDENSILLSANDSGDMMVCLLLSITPEDDPSETSQIMFYVTCFEEKTMITDVASGELFTSAPAAPEASDIDLAALSQDMAMKGFFAARDTIEEKGGSLDLPNEVTYTEKDDNELVKTVKQTLDENCQELDYSFELIIAEGTVSCLNVTVITASAAVSGSFSS